ncbi:hypothetical protein BML2531_15100 [Providencia rettgeri]|nr:hypothetical protein BML2531_15100 [Providencia rettgeri]
MLGKVEINGIVSHSVFRYLKNELSSLLGRRIKWNLTKFLIGSDDKPLNCFAPFTTPERMEAKILTAFES